VPRDLLDENGWGEKKRQDLARILADASKDHEPRKKLASLVPKDAPYARLRDALARLPGDRRARRMARPRPRARPEARRRGDACGALATGGSRRRAISLRPQERLRPRRRESRPRVPAPPRARCHGRVDAMTRRGPRRSVEKRIHTMELNLERRRWLPDSLPEPRVEVNIPAFALAVRDSGRTVMAMNVVVGRVASQTPCSATRSRTSS